MDRWDLARRESFAESRRVCGGGQVAMAGRGVLRVIPWLVRRRKRIDDENGPEPMEVISMTEDKQQLICTMEQSPHYIHWASARGLVDVVQILLAENPKRVHEHDAKGLTCLHHSAGRGQLAIIKMLLGHHADINAQDQQGNTSLHMAIEKGQLEAARELLKAGANGNVLNDLRLSPLIVATIANNTKALELLLSFPNLVDPNYRGEHGKRALHWAAKLEYPECVEILLCAGCRLCEPCDYGFFPVHFAAMKSSVKALECLLKYGEQKLGVTRERLLSYGDKESNSPLHLAVNSGNYEVVRVCLEHGAKIDLRQESQATPFHFACSQGTLIIVKLMFEHHLEQRGEPEAREILSATDNADMTPLHRAAMFDHVDVVKYLIEQGADINAIDRQKCSPLLLAAGKGATRSARVLVEAGANITLKDLNKRHILHFPVMYTTPKVKEAMEIIELICQREEGLRLLNMKDNSGCTPLHVASKQGHLKFAQTLIELGAIVNLKDNDDQSPLHFAARYGRYHTVRRLLDSSAGSHILNEIDFKGMTAVHVASENGHFKVVELLLERGASIHRNYRGQTPLHLATMNGHIQTIKLILTFHGTTLDQQCKNGYTALHYACEENQADAAVLLLSSKCEYLKNNDEIEPVEIAIQHRNTEVAMVMVQHDRWKEIFKRPSSLYGCPLFGLIQHLPEVHKAVLDRCIIKPENDISSRDTGMTYNFEFMQLPLERLYELRKHPILANAKRLATLNIMVQHGRVELLSHPVSLNFIGMKWRAYGMWFFLIHMLLYVTFMCCLTVPIILSNYCGRICMPSVSINLDNASDTTGENSDSTEFYYNQQTSHTIEHFRPASGYLLIFAFANMVKEFVQMYQQRVRYIVDYINYMEWTMYISTVIFAAPAFWYEKVGESEWQCGSVAVFLAWFNLLLYLQRLETVGLYVVMFLQILNTVLKVILVFTVLFVAFGMAFFMLLAATPNGSYKTPWVSILQALMELMGEYNYVDVYVKPYFELGGAKPLKFAALNFVFLVIFVILMPILFVNLLIGLAVGDIEMVQRDARLKRLAMQVEYHTELEQKLPLWLLKKVDQTQITVTPCREKLGKRGIIGKILASTNLLQNEALGRSHMDEMWRHNQPEISNDAIVEELENLRRRMKELQTKTGNMHDLLRLIVQKMEITTEADTYEGRRQSDEDEEDGMSGRTSARRRILRLRAKVTPLTLRSGRDQ